jgi:hypothetical protein
MCRRSGTSNISSFQGIESVFKRSGTRSRRMSCLTASLRRLRLLPRLLSSLQLLRLLRRRDDGVRRHQDAWSGSGEGRAEQDKRHLDELTSERRQARVQPQLAEEDAQILRAPGVLGLGADADAVVSP